LGVLSQKRGDRQHLAGIWAVKMTAVPRDVERIRLWMCTAA
jgi:hypothetical protein